MHKLITILTNVPSHYRIHEFNLLSKSFLNKGCDFEVLFMSKNENWRHWLYKPENWSFKHILLRGLIINIKNIYFAINLPVIAYILKNAPAIFIIGGGWNIPTSILAAVFTRIFQRKTTMLFWVEATVSYTKHSKKGVFRWFRKLFFSLFDAYIVPSVSSIDYINKLLPTKKNSFIFLSNFVDETDYFLEVRENKARFIETKRINEEVVCLIPARLSPEKGLLEFLGNISNFPREKFSILIAGDGPLRNELQKFLIKNEFNNIKLLGFQDKKKMLELYALADIMILPSLREPFGFVAVEALWAGLPLLLSENVGAISEVLLDGKNGWQFNPSDSNSVSMAFKRVLQASKKDLQCMGEVSLEIAKQRFSSDLESSKFADNLLKIAGF